MMKWTIAAAAMLAMAAQLPAAVLVQNGQTRCQIVTAPDAPRETAAAAKELAAYFKQISGATVPVTHKASGKTPVKIWLGANPAMPADLQKLTKFDQREQIVIAVHGDDVVVAGNDVVVGKITLTPATREAVYTFLQKDLKVRWLWPGELGQDIVPMKTIELKDDVYRYQPQLVDREIRIANHAKGLAYYPKVDEELKKKMENLDLQSRQWLARQRGGRTLGIARAGHAFTTWYKQYGQTHPDYFALQPDGSRTPYPSAETVKIDPSNPAVWKQWLDNASATLNKYPSVHAISAAIDDSAYSGFCVCPVCESWDAKDGPKIELQWKGVKKEHVALTDRYAQFWNKIAAGLKEKFPDRDVYVAVLAYCATRTPPLHTTLLDNIIVGFVGPLGSKDDAARKEDLALWTQWSDKAAHLYWRPNMFNYMWGLPALFAQRSGEDFAYLADHHLLALDIDSCQNDWSTQGLQYYLLAQLAWNPRADVKALEADYIERAFGKPSAPAMHRYFDSIEKAYVNLVNEAADLNRYQNLPVFMKVFNADLRRQLRADLNEAKKAAASDLYRKRLAFIETGLNFTDAQFAVLDATTALRAGKGNVQTLARNAMAACEARDAIVQENVDGFALNGPGFYTNLARRKMADYLGPLSKTYTDLAANASSGITPLPLTWDFRLDPKDVGQKQRWFDAAEAKKLKWQPINVTTWWGSQLLSDDPVDPVTHQYVGVAWYAIDADLPAPKAGQTVNLVLGGVDESCWVYVNGKQVGQLIYNAKTDPDSWKKPQSFDVTKALKPGQNHIAVRVQSLFGEGGLYRPAKLIYK
jgi:hypothetical protein